MWSRARQDCLVDLQELRSEKGARRAAGAICRSLVEVAAAARGTGFTCRGWAPVARGLRWATAPVLPGMPVADRLLLQPKLCKLALLANKSLKGTAFKDLADCIPGYQETTGQAAKSHHRK